MLEKLATWRNTEHMYCQTGSRVASVVAKDIPADLVQIRLRVGSTSRYLELREKLICGTGSVVAFSGFSQPQDLIDIHLLRGTKENSTR
jgi:hypothetical protein